MFLAHGELVVLETEDEVLLGTAELVDDAIVLRSGFVGRPTIVPVSDVVRLTLAAEHEDVEGL